MRGVLSRRELLRYAGALGLASLSGCVVRVPTQSSGSSGSSSSGGSSSGGSSGSGSSGSSALFRSANRIMDLSNVRDARSLLEDSLVSAGIDYSPVFYDDSSLDPPFIEGRYSISGTTTFPFLAPLAEGTIAFSNQTADNEITTDYSQFAGQGLSQSGTNRISEIIRGEGNRFTVYSAIEIGGAPCFDPAAFILIFDGVQDSRGLSGAYLSVPRFSHPCWAESGGVFDFAYLGAPKSRSDYVSEEAEKIRRAIRENRHGRDPVGFALSR